DNADLGVPDCPPQRIHGCTMRKVDVMHAAQEGLPVGQSRCLPAKGIAEQREDPGFVESCETLDAVSIAVTDERSVVGEPADAITMGPAALVIESLRQVPMIQTDPRLDSSGKQFID